MKFYTEEGKKIKWKNRETFSAQLPVRENKESNVFPSAAVFFFFFLLQSRGLEFSRQICF